MGTPGWKWVRGTDTVSQALCSSKDSFPNFHGTCAVNAAFIQEDRGIPELQWGLWVMENEAGVPGPEGVSPGATALTLEHWRAKAQDTVRAGSQTASPSLCSPFSSWMLADLDRSREKNSWVITFLLRSGINFNFLLFYCHYTSDACKWLKKKKDNTQSNSLVHWKITLIILCISTFSHSKLHLQSH